MDDAEQPAHDAEVDALDGGEQARVAPQVAAELVQGLQRFLGLADELGVSLRKEAYYVVDSLKKLASYMEESSPKEVELRDYIRNHTDETIAVVVPKAYYASVLKEKMWFVYRSTKRNIR